MRDMLAIQGSQPPLPGPLTAEAHSFGAFYVDALPHVYGYFLRRCGGSRAVAEDLTQETFLAAVAQLRKGGRVDAPLGWAMGIARHKLVDHYRRQARMRWSAASADDEVEAQGESEAAREFALAALARVPSAQRAALVLRHLDGLSVPEVASALGRSVEAAESLLARGRVNFRRAYAEVIG